MAFQAAMGDYRGNHKRLRNNFSLFECRVGIALDLLGLFLKGELLGCGSFTGAACNTLITSSLTRCLSAFL